MAQQLQLSSARLAEAVQQNNDLVSQVTDLQNEVNQIAENLAEQRRKLQQTSEELARVTARADQLLSRNSRTARLPTVRGWTGQGTAAFFLKEGSLCYLRDPRQSAERIVDGSTIIEPVPSAGLRIDPARTDQAALETLFRRFSTQRHLIRIWVAPDSHEQWGAVRDTVVRLGFRYQLEPIPPDQYLILTDSPTAELRAQ